MTTKPRPSTTKSLSWIRSDETQTLKGTMNVLDYVRENYGQLPKSTFNDEEVVIVFEMSNSNEGWGNHSYSGYGVDRDGRLFYCFSSGCSCNGSCGVDHVEDTKKLEIDPTEFPNFQSPEKIDFSGLAISFSDY